MRALSLITKGLQGRDSEGCSHETVSLGIVDRPVKVLNMLMIF